MPFKKKRGRFWILFGAVLTLVLPVSGQQTWNNVNSGSWSKTSNWSPVGSPNAIGASATLGDVIKAARTVTLDVDVTLGTLNFSGDNNYSMAGTKSLTFDATAGNAVINISGKNASQIGTAPTNLLTVSMVLTDNLVINHSGSGDFKLAGAISGAGGIVKNGSGTALLYGYHENAYTGATIVNDGMLVLDTYTLRNGSIKGTTVVVGDGIGAAESAVLRNGPLIAPYADEMINDAATVSFGSDGLWAINNENETVSALNFAGGRVRTGTGLLTLASATPVTTEASSGTALIEGNLRVTGGGTGEARFEIADGSAAIDAEISAAVSGTTRFVKQGEGSLRLSGASANTLSGTTTVEAGTLELAKAGGVAAIAGSSITVNSGGTLLLGNSEQISNSTGLILSGGEFSTGAGFNETLGTLTLTSDSRITLGDTIHNLRFGASNLAGWDAAASLTIYGWAADPSGAGISKVFFGTNTGSLTTQQLSQIHFDGFTGSMLLANGELVPTAVPEAEAYLAALLVACITVWRERTRFLPRLQSLCLR